MNKRQWYELVEENIELNLEKFYLDMYKADLENLGSSSYRVNPCPACGHNDSCTINVEQGYVNCFSGDCWFKGNHLHTFIKYVEEKLDPPKNTKQTAILLLEKWTGIPYPKYNSKIADKIVRLQKIRNIAIEFYHKQLLESRITHTVENKVLDRMESMTPLEYQTNIRKHSIEALNDFEVGFSSNSYELTRKLKEEGFSEDEIKKSGMIFPQGLFLYPYRDPVTRDILRVNTKNGLGITITKDGEEREIKGFSTEGDKKYCLFSPKFKKDRDVLIVEGENDGISCYEEGFLNVVVLGGSITETSEQLNTLEEVTGIFYVATDNDGVGDNYYKCLDSRFPHKDVRRVPLPKEFKDIDEYYKYGENVQDIFSLVEQSEFVETEKYKISKLQTKIWAIENRHKKIVFTINNLDKTGQLAGRVDYFVDGKPEDMIQNTPLSKCKTKMKPYSFYLADAVEEFFNRNINNRTTDELLEIYFLSTHKAEIERELANRLYALEGEEKDLMASKFKLALTSDIADLIFAETSNISNSKVLSTLGSSCIPKMRLAQFFSIKNNDAYFYFTDEKVDGDAIRRLPYLLRNDGLTIRLDLLKRKDVQCLLLVDNKYELQNEVDVAVMEHEECSLYPSWATKFKKGEIEDVEINPSLLIKEIVNEMEKFYYFKDKTTYKVLALYIMATYYYELFGQMPYLFLNGQKGSGKSTLLAALKLYCFNAKFIVDITEAGLFRLCSFEGGTIILDEMENLTSRAKTQDSTMASVLKGGYSNSGGVYRHNQEKGVTESFNIYTPKIIANIFGLDDVIADRCIEVRTYRFDMSKGEHQSLEDPKLYKDLHMDEIKNLTSRCCISALKYFQILYKIYTDKKTQIISTNSPRSAQIMKPLLAVARFVDMFEVGLESQYNTLDFETIKGSFESALLEYHDSVVVSAKEELEATTPEGILKSVVEKIALELGDSNYPEENKEYTVTENYKYDEPIQYSLEENWFEVNLAHFKCLLEQHLPGEQTYPRILAKNIKNTLQPIAIKRKIITLKDPDLIKEWKSEKPKVNTYRFQFSDFIDIDVLNTTLDKNNDLF